MVALRRRVDWTLILGKDAPTPAMLDSSAPADLAALIAAFDELLLLEDADATLRRAAELALERIKLTRVGLFLLDAPPQPDARHLGHRSQRSNRRRASGHVRPRAKMIARSFGARRAASRSRSSTTARSSSRARRRRSSSGAAGVACTPIRSARASIRHAVQRLRADGRAARPAEAGAHSDSVLDARHRARSHARPAGPEPRFTRARGSSARSPDRARARQDPSLGGKDLASSLDISLSRLARVFKAEMGMSLVEYRIACARALPSVARRRAGRICWLRRSRPGSGSYAPISSRFSCAARLDAAGLLARAGSLGASPDNELVPLRRDSPTLRHSLGETPTWRIERAAEGSLPKRSRPRQRPPPCWRRSSSAGGRRAVVETPSGSSSALGRAAR